MMRNDLLQFQHKKVRLFLRNGYCYTGSIVELGTDALVFFDKYGITSSHTYEAINGISEVKA